MKKALGTNGSADPAAKTRVVIIGGGLAGMTVAKSLLEAQRERFEVTILEASPRLGGKAGADYDDKRDIYLEHGYHIFPGWYANLDRLLSDIGAHQNLVAIEKFHILKADRWKRDGTPVLNTFYPMSSPWHLLQNVLSLADLLSLPEAVLGFYAMLDLISESFDQRAALDQVSANGFFRSRFYATESLAEFHIESILQATSVPTYQISAMTLRKATSLWFAEDISRWSWLPSSLVDAAKGMSFLLSDDPFGATSAIPQLPQEAGPLKVYSILNGNLQSRFIEPFVEHLKRLGADIQPECRVLNLVMEDGRVTAVNTRTGTASRVSDREITADVFVLATPPEVTAQFVDPSLQDAEQLRLPTSDDTVALSDVGRLETSPMAGMQIVFNRRIPNMPKEHVNLLRSRYGLSFIDVSQHWDELSTVWEAIAKEEAAAAAAAAGAAVAQRPRTTGKPVVRCTVLSVIAANFTPLVGLDPDDAIQHLINELLTYVPARWEDIWYSYRPVLHKNDTAPLYLNTVGSWQFRPYPRTRIDNLFAAGDYCKTEVDLTTMESAAASGLAAAREILSAHGVADAERRVAIQPLRRPDRKLILALKYMFLPLVPLLSAGPRLWKLLDRFVVDPEAERKF